MSSAFYFLKNIAVEVPEEISFSEWRKQLSGWGEFDFVYGPAITLYDGKPIILREWGVIGMYLWQEKSLEINITLKEALKLEEEVEEIVE